MQLEIKFKSIAMRWFFNVFLIVIVAVGAVAVFFSVTYSTLYVERVQTLADDYAADFSALSNASGSTFYSTAVSIAADFKYKDKIEVQVIDKRGDVIVSTTGFIPPKVQMPDYESALNSDSGKAGYNGKLSYSGENILAYTTIVKNSNNKVLGAYRWVVSLEEVNSKKNNFTFILLTCCLGVLAFSALSGIFFIKSIVRPIRDVGNMARKIAMGDFDSRITIEKMDEIGELCDAINYMASELSESAHMKSDFISSVSHELRTPLTAIRGWGETAKMSVGTDEELVRRGLDVVLSEADRLSGLVEELLDFSRMENGRLVLEARPVDVSFLLGEASDMYTELARKQGIDLIFARSAEAVIVSGDPNRLKQVFINIIDNAVKYTEAGGQVLVEQTLEEGCVRILVKDTGVGIPAQDIDRVKEKFYKANKTVRGSGIGLAVADEIIKQHKGLLFVESTEGVGTTVTIVLPLYEPPEELDESKEEPEHQANDSENKGDING